VPVLEKAAAEPVTDEKGFKSEQTQNNHNTSITSAVAGSDQGAMGERQIMWQGQSLPMKK
jgi:hypothetical protein